MYTVNSLNINRNIHSKKFSMKTRFARDGLTWPGHNYLGPGNTIYKEDPPTDDVDFDALVHDLEYELATTRKTLEKQIEKLFTTS